MCVCVCSECVHSLGGRVYKFIGAVVLRANFNGGGGEEGDGQFPPVSNPKPVQGTRPRGICPVSRTHTNTHKLG